MARVINSIIHRQLHSPRNVEDSLIRLEFAHINFNEFSIQRGKEQKNIIIHNLCKSKTEVEGEVHPTIEHLNRYCSVEQSAKDGMGGMKDSKEQTQRVNTTPPLSPASVCACVSPECDGGVKAKPHPYLYARRPFPPIGDRHGGLPISVVRERIVFWTNKIIEDTMNSVSVCVLLKDLDLGNGRRRTNDHQHAHQVKRSSRNISSCEWKWLNY